jgi:hypothetical protein
LQNIHDAAARDRAVIDLQKEILSAQSEQFTLLQRVDDLENEVARLKAWEADKKRYKLVELRPGVIAYSLKADMANGKPQHQLCTACYEVGFKSILKSEVWDPGRYSMIACQGCGWFAYMSGSADPSHHNLRPTPYHGE